MLGQDVVERGAEPGQPAAQIERIDLERQRPRRRRELTTARGLGAEELIFDVGGLSHGAYLGSEGVIERVLSSLRTQGPIPTGRSE
jgi:hypothetical protein